MVKRDPPLPFFHISRNWPVAIDKIMPSETECYRNFLCTVQGNLEL